MLLRRTCKEMTALVIAREDRVLPWRDSLAMRLHMSVCVVCPILDRQVFTMRNAMTRWRNYESDESLTRNIQDELRQKP